MQYFLMHTCSHMFSMHLASLLSMKHPPECAFMCACVQFRDFTYEHCMHILHSAPQMQWNLCDIWLFAGLLRPFNSPEDHYCLSFWVSDAKMSPVRRMCMCVCHITWTRFTHSSLVASLDAWIYDHPMHLQCNNIIHLGFMHDRALVWVAAVDPLCLMHA